MLTTAPPSGFLCGDIRLRGVSRRKRMLKRAFQVGLYRGALSSVDWWDGKSLRHVSQLFFMHIFAMSIRESFQSEDGNGWWGIGEGKDVIFGKSSVMYTFILRLVLEPVGQIPEDSIRTFWSPGQSPKDVSVVPDDAENPENIRQPVLVKDFVMF
jgi:hypothetical protein